MKLLSHHLQLWRAARGLSQKELALRAGVPRPNLIAIELGRRDCTVGTLEKLASALEVRPGKLLDEIPVNPKRPLGRFERDALARALIIGKEPTFPKLSRPFRDLRPLFRPSLQAIGRWPSTKKRGFVRRRKYHLETLYSSELVEDIIERVRRLLPSFIEVKNDQKGH